MAVDPHSAFQSLMSAWEEFHAAVMETEDGEAPRVLRAARHLADAYTVYDDVIFTNFGVEAPFDTYEDDADDDGDWSDSRRDLADDDFEVTSADYDDEDFSDDGADYDDDEDPYSASSADF